MHPVPGNQARRSGFSLVELLVVIGIIAVLMGLLLPSLGRAREQARTVVCQSNLQQIYALTIAYANQNRDKFPDAYTTGNFSYRMAPGRKTPGDPGALEEVYGLQAVLVTRASPGDGGGAWTCRSQPDWMQEHENTYAFSVSANLKRYTSKDRVKEKEVFAWDNFTLRPGLSGFRGPFSSYTIPVAERYFPHRYGPKQRTVNDLYLDGHVAPRTLN